MDRLVREDLVVLVALAGNEHRVSALRHRDTQTYGAPAVDLRVDLGRRTSQTL
jgi:hypothetical protein